MSSDALNNWNGTGTDARTARTSGASRRRSASTRHPSTTTLSPPSVAPQSDGVTLDTSVAAIEVAAAGVMSAIVPERFARGALAAGRVTRAVDVHVPMRQSHYVLWPERSAPSSEALAFMQWLGELDGATEP